MFYSDSAVRLSDRNVAFKGSLTALAGSASTRS